jgi:hypothetical protein
MTTTLMHTTLANLTRMPPTEALTGPLKRADVATIQSHIQALDDPLWKSLYTTLGQATIPWVKLTPEKQAMLERSFLLDGEHMFAPA